MHESFLAIYHGTVDLLDRRKIHSRRFRYYANRLITFLNAKDVNVSKKYKDSIASRLVGGIECRPDCADQICALVRAIGPSRKLQMSLVQWATNLENITFEWAVYSVIKMLTEQGCRSKILQKYCCDRLNDPKASDPIRGISAIHLNKKAHKLIENSLSQSNSHFLQRHLLIALAHEKPETLKKKQTMDKIHPDFIGTHFKIHKTTKLKDFSLIRKTEKLSQRVLIKELRSYA